MAVLTYDEKIIIRYIRRKYGYGAKRIIADHPEYDWKLCTIKDLLKKIDDTGGIERKEGSGRPRSARTEENIEMVDELICSQEEKPGTHMTPASIAMHLGDVSESSVRRMVKKDLKLRPLKKIKCQALTEINREKRVERCSKLLRVYSKPVLDTAFFSDEKSLKCNNFTIIKTTVSLSRRTQRSQPSTLTASYVSSPDLQNPSWCQSAFLNWARPTFILWT